MKKIDSKTISHAQCIRELRREIGTRNRIYPNWIAQNKIDEEVAAQRNISTLRFDLRDKRTFKLSSNKVQKGI